MTVKIYTFAQEIGRRKNILYIFQKDPKEASFLETRLLDVGRTAFVRAYTKDPLMNTNNKTTVTLSPYRRIAMAGFDIEVRHHSHQFRVLLKNGSENVAVAFAPRGGGMAADEALAKARLNTWGPSSGFYEVLTRFADIAETLAARPQQ